MGLFDKALVDFDAALDLDPDNIASLYNKANCLKAAGRLLEARGVYLRLLECAPDHFDGLNNLGNLFRELGEPQAALDCFD
ncbi:tetratricopeptide repeat protein, partial [Acinetobacter baumannii]